MTEQVAGTTSLRFALVLFVVLPLSLLLIIGTYSVLRVVESQAEQRMKDDVELVARTLQQPLSRALERDRLRTVEEALASAFRIRRVYSAHVYDGDGRTVAHIGRQELFVDSDRVSDMAGEQSQRGEYEEISGQAVYSYFAPLTSSGGAEPRAAPHHPPCRGDGSHHCQPLVAGRQPVGPCHPAYDGGSSCWDITAPSGAISTAWPGVWPRSRKATAPTAPQRAVRAKSHGWAKPSTPCWTASRG